MCGGREGQVNSSSRTHTHICKYQTDRCELVQPLWKTAWSMEVPQKPKIELPYDSAIPLLGTYPDKIKIQKDICACVYTSTSHNSQDMEAV